jgi:hypothetical protein
LRILGALIALTLQTKDDAASSANTLQTVSSMPLRFPSLSNKGTVIIILKLAIGATEICLLLFGVKYGSSGDTITELARTVAGGKAKVCHLALFTKAVAKVVRSVVMATGGITPPLN